MTLSPAYSLLDFDCGGRHLNVTSVSLLNSGDCNLDVKATNHSKIYIQLLQISDYNYAEVIQCKVEVIRTVYYCEMYLHFRSKWRIYLHEVGLDRCKEMHQDGSANNLFNHVTGLKVNNTNLHSLTIAG